MHTSTQTAWFKSDNTCKRWCGLHRPNTTATAWAAMVLAQSFQILLQCTHPPPTTTLALAASQQTPTPQHAQFTVWPHSMHARPQHSWAPHTAIDAAPDISWLGAVVQVWSTSTSACMCHSGVMVCGSSLCQLQPATTVVCIHMHQRASASSSQEPTHTITKRKKPGRNLILSLAVVSPPQ